MAQFYAQGYTEEFVVCGNTESEDRMRYVLKAAEMKEYDQNTTERIGIPSLVLMERAALSVVQAMDEQGILPGRVLVVAGTGNNGGDGLAVGRLLSQRGVEVTFYMEGNPQHMTQQTKTQRQILENLGLSVQSKSEAATYNIEGKETVGAQGDGDYDLVIDALFGIGLSREITGSCREWVETINALKEKGSLVWSLDIPSGICADTGRIMGCAVRADVTVSFAFAKRGHFLYPGKVCTGKLIVKEIGITKESFGERFPAAFCLEKADLPALMPKRQPGGNKGTFGKVLLMAGSRDMSGACVLCAGAVMRTGAGMVKIITPACNREIVQQSLPEAMLFSFAEEGDAHNDAWPGEYFSDSVKSAMDWADVLVVGPGMGTGRAAYFLLKQALEYRRNRDSGFSTEVHSGASVGGSRGLPMVIDADALNLIAAREELRGLVRQRAVCSPDSGLILTPHPGELVRLMHQDMQAYQRDREGMVRALAQEFSCTVVAKDATTLVMGAEREEICLNNSGNDGMATAGSGDVLAGILGGLLAQGLGGFEAAGLGVFLHGLAGDEAARKCGRYGMLAGDIIKGLNRVIKNMKQID